MEATGSSKAEPVWDLRLAVVTLGVWAATLIGLYTSFWWALTVLVLASLTVWCGRRSRRDWVVLLATIAIGMAAGAAATAGQVAVRDADPFHSWAADGKTATLTVTVADDPLKVKMSAEPRHRIPVHVTRAVAGGRDVDLSVRAVAFADDREWSGWGELLPGQELTIRGRLAAGDTAKLESAVVFITGRPKLHGTPPWWQTASGKLREGLRRACEGLPAEPRGLLPGLALGDVSTMESNVDSDFRDAGMTHLLAVSGSNVAIVVGSVVVVAVAFGTRRRGRTAIGLVAIVCFVVLVRPSPSVLRAAVMGALGLFVLARSGGRAALPMLSAAVVVLLLVDPGLATSLGFVLSVLATAGLLLFASRWAGGLRKRGWPPWLATATAVPAAAQLAVTPVLAAATGTITPVAVVANAVAAVAVPPATVLSVLATVVHPWWPDAASVLVWLAGWPARWLIFVAGRAADVPAGTVSWPSGFVAGLLLAVGMATCLVLLRWRVSRRFLAVALLGIVVGVAPVRLLTGTWPPNDWAMIVCDVGQGDALLLPTADSSRVIVVDAGPDPRAVDDCLRSVGAETIALLVFSHLHADHVNGVKGVYTGRTVEAVMRPDTDQPEVGQRRVVSATADTPKVTPMTGSTIDLGRTQLSVLGPDSRFSGTRSDANNNSLVLRANVDGTRILLSGDVEVPAQRSVVTAGNKLAADVLKVPHHGSSYFDTEFFASVAPRLAVISVGKGNDYGHPHPKTLSQLRGQHATVMRTDRHGTFAVLAANGDLEVMTMD